MPLSYLNKIALGPKKGVIDSFREKSVGTDLSEFSDVEFHEKFSEELTELSDEDLDAPMLEFFLILYLIFSNFALVQGLS